MVLGVFGVAGAAGLSASAWAWRAISRARSAAARRSWSFEFGRLVGAVGTAAAGIGYPGVGSDGRRSSGGPLPSPPPSPPPEPPPLPADAGGARVAAV